MDTQPGLSLKRLPRFRPRTPRVAVAIEASLILPDDQIVPITIRNLSDRGFMALCPMTLAPQTWLGVELPGFGIVRGCVRWSEDGELGCEFRAPIDLDRMSLD